MTHRPSLRSVLNAATLALGLSVGWGALPTAHAADTASPMTTKDGREARDLKAARELIARKDWKAAAGALTPFTQAYPDNADGFNLLGYSLRNLKQYDPALAAYTEALRLNPNHRGAHEYMGVAYVELGQLPKAKEHLDALDKICTFSCEEYRDLKKAYEAALARK